MIQVRKIIHRGATQILLSFNYNQELLKKLKTIERIHYSKTYHGWYIPYESKCWKSFLALDIPHEIIDSKKGIAQDTLEGGTNQNEKAEHILTGSAPHSPAHSDNTGITSYKDVTSTLSLNGENGESDIHQITGGREVWFSGGKFVLKIPYNTNEVQFVKSLNGWWHKSAKKWIVKGTLENLVSIQAYYNVWDNNVYNRIEDILLMTAKPYVVTIYRVPEERHFVIVRISGFKANIDIVKRMAEREYLKEHQRWKIPNDPILVNRLIDSYRKDGATIINRLPLIGEDYQKNRPSYGEWKRRWLEKVDVDLRDIIEQYLDALGAMRYSLRTFDSYLGAFLKYVRHVGKDNVNQATSADIRNYMAKLGAPKVSESLLNTSINSIKFYYQHVIFNKELVIEEIKRPKKSKPLPVILSTKEIDRLLRSTENLKHTTLLFTLYSSGMRLNEILHLRVEDLWWDREQIMIRSGKGKKDRIVPFSGVLKLMLMRYFDEYKPIYWVFEGQDRKYQYSEKSVQNVVKRAAKSANIQKKVTPHTIRHCFATHLLDGGTDVRYIQELLGHANITTTLIYTHVTNQSIDKIVSPLDRLMGSVDSEKYFRSGEEKSES
ncbi:MAG: tyrosine-type recombinase/integrase [Saprospiraceae bacterium]